MSEPKPTMEYMNEMLAFARQLQEKHDLRNSELVSALLATALAVINPQ